MQPQQAKPEFRLDFRQLVFATALCCLMFEIVLARLVDYHLGAENAYLALPIAFLGLALGSLYVHFRPALLERFNMRRELIILVSLVVGGLLFAFLFFSWVMPATSTMAIATQLDYMAKKTAVFVVVMVAPFISFGRILTSMYQLRREEIGSIYAADLLGAALACALTPVAFHFGGLPTVIIVLIVLSFIPLLLSSSTRKQWITVGVAGLVVAIGSERLIHYADSTVSLREWGTATKYEELERAWNEHSRVALIKKLPKQEGGPTNYVIIHNNSRSNVHVTPYKDRDRTARVMRGLEAPWVLGREPKNILVMFAGTGAEMIAFDEFAHRKAKITGVELNGLVKKFGREGEAIQSYKIAEFLDQDRIDLVIDEGRHFLTTRPEGTKYDFIYLGSNAATTAVTGHTTKYLDTVEAYNTYLDLLAPGGIMVFDHQPLEQRIFNMRQVFAQRGIENFEDCVIVMDDPAHGNDDMILAPDGFSDDEIAKVMASSKSKDKNVRRRVEYLNRPGFRGRKYEPYVEGELGMTFVDDRPFMQKLETENYELMPPEGKKTVRWYLSWIKITTVIVLSSIALLFIGVAALKRDARAPVPVLLYLLLTGFSFMLCEVAIMAKLELFLTQPLLSMAAVLSLFLLTSGVGSSIYPRLSKLHDTRVLAALAAVAVVIVMLLLEWMNHNLLHLPVALKLVLATLAVAPLGTVLGLFYPHVVSCLVDQDRAQTVSISYGLSTLSSVVGSAYALAAMINVGFNALLQQAAMLYVALLVFAVIYKLAGGRWLSRSS
jgi:spermidine synthase